MPPGISCCRTWLSGATNSNTFLIFFRKTLWTLNWILSSRLPLKHKKYMYILTVVIWLYCGSVKIKTTCMYLFFAFKSWIGPVLRPFFLGQQLDRQRRRHDEQNGRRRKGFWEREGGCQCQREVDPGPVWPWKRTTPKWTSLPRLPASPSGHGDPKGGIPRSW